MDINKFLDNYESAKEKQATKLAEEERAKAAKLDSNRKRIEWIITEIMVPYLMEIRDTLRARGYYAELAATTNTCTFKAGPHEDKPLLQGDLIFSGNESSGYFSVRMNYTHVYGDSLPQLPLSIEKSSDLQGHVEKFLSKVFTNS